MQMMLYLPRAYAQGTMLFSHQLEGMSAYTSSHVKPKAGLRSVPQLHSKSSTRCCTPSLCTVAEQCPKCEEGRCIPHSCIARGPTCSMTLLSVKGMRLLLTCEATPGQSTSCVSTKYAYLQAMDCNYPKTCL
jgi:hypothetical protein